MTHDVFVDGVIDDLFQEDITAVVVVGAVADAPDVHARAQPDVLQRRQRLDLALVVNVLGAFSHKWSLKPISIRRARADANRIRAALENGTRRRVVVVSSCGATTQFCVFLEMSHFVSFWFGAVT
jgi:hypothetical protein